MTEKIVRKRKSPTTATTPKPIKKPRHTLDSYFSTTVPIVQNCDASGESTISHIALSPEQITVLRMVVDGGKNVFFTGAAGTGKSLLLRAIINGLRKKYAKQHDAVAITASTAMAASNIGGQTIHAWGAIAPTVDDIDHLIKCIKTCRPALKRWKQAKVLIIDEVSMVDGHMFGRLAEISKRLRKETSKPFGGLQLVVTGDFFQLPPVTKGSAEPYFAFESPAWQETLQSTVNLVKVFRQKDQRFVDALNSLRQGEPTSDAIELFSGLSNPIPPVFISTQVTQATQDTSTPTQPTSSQYLSPRQARMRELLPTELFPLRASVAAANRERLDALHSMRFTFTSTDSGEKQQMLDSLLSEPVLDLKLGAQVMLIKNVDEFLVNGIVGKVIGFYRSWELMSGEAPDRKPLSSLGSTTNSAKPPSSSASNQKKNGALVRHVQLNETGKAVLTTEDKKATVEDENVKDEKKKKKAASKTKKDEERYPLVLFQYGVPGSIGEVQTEAVLLKRDEFTVEDAEGKILARRVQLPLILAWAMSIHKSQGQTIHRVKVDLSNVFERGQSYVALSRASSLEGLQVIGFNPRKVMAHQKVIEWNKSLQVLSQ